MVCVCVCVWFGINHSPGFLVPPPKKVLWARAIYAREGEEMGTAEEWKNGCGVDGGDESAWEQRTALVVCVALPRHCPGFWDSSSRSQRYSR